MEGLQAGITHCFVNLGSDHPSILEAIVQGQNSKSGFPRIITCPNEMVALSMADGYARLTNKPQCVIVHVDVGTSGMGAAVHNASIGRAPVLIFAGLSPFTMEGESRGSRTEFIHWLQDVPDQKQIVAQYCRYVGEIKSAKNIKQVVGRALQFACSDPKGPAYLMGAREIMEEEIQPYDLQQEHWNPVGSGALPADSLESIAKLLLDAKEPLIICGYTGRNHAAVTALVRLADTIKGIRVLDTGGSDMCFPADHPAWLGFRYGSDESIKTADVILVLDCDVPFINTQCKPNASAKMIHIDVDPLKTIIPLFYLPAVYRYRADSQTAMTQLTEYISQHPSHSETIASPEFTERWTKLQESHKARVLGIAKLAVPRSDNAISASHMARTVRNLCPPDTIFAVEAVTNAILVSDQIQATQPGQWIHCGGGGLGWSGGGALGIKMATDALEGAGKGKMVVQIVGDGSYLFSVPSSVYWISRRYQIPILTIVLNNRGWNAPRRSMLLVHPDGLGSRSTNDDLNIAFEPSPNYPGIARAASGDSIHAARVADAKDLESVMKEAIAVVLSGTTAVVEVAIAV
ncbi:related to BENZOYLFORMATE DECARBOXYLASE [Rhynchosporium secalis]|uniref:Related to BENZOYLFORMATE DECARBOXYLASE n=1 Tax=Rhynchosporium secalis TaxID=38038 RepID=A0A1E1MUF8_RHYSE|nr:related to BENZOYLFORMATE DECARBOXYLASE [Rhynchosporium secalis]